MPYSACPCEINFADIKWVRQSIKVRTEQRWPGQNDRGGISKWERRSERDPHCSCAHIAGSYHKQRSRDCEVALCQRSRLPNDKIGAVFTCIDSQRCSRSRRAVSDHDFDSERVIIWRPGILDRPAKQFNDVCSQLLSCVGFGVEGHSNS